ncbi:ADOP family duplicated permease [Acidicapsa dinghuensis]|uniref:ADOP family duplicated permease n=1 Tax=Acidicapsa dinghuensis TaxID=2218256 RepID=A0ABW1EKR0_9BACT|nr:ABC transporter permease [Acidicapsa dinghuensis]
MAWTRRITNLFRRNRLADEIEAELDSHLALRADDNRISGMSPASARRDARVRFGNPQVVRESVTSADAALSLEGFWLDLRYGLRQLRRNPGFAATAIGVLALGICASTAIFAFVDAVLISPLPYRDPARIMGLFETNPLGPRFHLSYLDYLDWKRMNHTFDAIEAYDAGSLAMQSPTGIERVDEVTISAGFLRTLGISPLLGRDFRDGEDLPAAPSTALISYSVWQKRYGGQPDVLGKTVTIDNVTSTIVGVLPKDFYFAGAGPAEFWIVLHASDKADTRGEHNLSGLGKLKPGVTVAQAQADMSNVAAILAKQYPGYDDGRGATVVPWTEVVTGKLQSILLLLMCGAVLLLLIAGVNVSSLLLVRSENRRREIAVRGALGASRMRLVRQFVIEGLMLAATACVLGVGAAYGQIHVLVKLVPAGMLAAMPYLTQLGINLHVLGFALMVAILAAIQFSLTPLFRLSFETVREGLGQGGPSAAGTVWRHFGSNLVVVELCTAMVLLSGAGLLGRSFYRLMHADTGMQTDHLATLRITASSLASYAKPYQQVALSHQVLDEIRRLPGVESAAITRQVPLANVAGGSTTFNIVGRPPHQTGNEADMRQVSAGYFSTVRARLMRGRFFTEHDDATQPIVTIINQSFARKYFPGEDPIGRRLSFDDSQPAWQIAGIIDNIREGPMDAEVGPALYVPFDQVPDNVFYVVARTAGEPELILKTLEQTVRRINPDFLLYDGETMDNRIEKSQSAYLHRSAAWLVGGFAAIALLLGVIGLYGVIAYSVSQRTREIGVRMALGAQRSSVYAMVMGEAGRLIVIGVAAGLVCSIAAAMLMRSLLFGTAPWDVATLTAVGVILAASALTASYLPARRAASVNPIEALRVE